MVQLMKRGESEPPTVKMAGVKLELEDSFEEEHGPLQKRHKQHSLEVGCYAPQASRYNPLEEPSPLGLRLKKSPSLLELIQMKLSQASSPKAGAHSHGKKESNVSAASRDKLKASNFPASTLKIGTWEYKSRYEGDLVAKCYFAKHKLVWEVLDGGLKNKIEIQWSNIVALKANYPDDSHGTLDVVLARQPLFFKETNPQPRKHTLWQSTSDFTGGQASVHRRHYMECTQGLLGKHFEKLIQCDPRLYFLSQKGMITLDSPYFEPLNSVFDDQSDQANESDLNREGSPSIFSVHDADSPSWAHSYSSKNDQDGHGKHSGSYPRETRSPTSALITPTYEDIKAGGIEQLKAVSDWDQIKVPGIHSSMSMSNLVSHLENRISEQGASSNLTFSSEEWQSLQILDDINRCLFTDIQHMPDSDKKTLMSRVNSLCCLLEKDSSAGTNMQSRIETCSDISLMQQSTNELSNFGTSSENYSMSRKDSVGDFLLNLPRIASLPQFLFNISEDFENHAR